MVFTSTPGAISSSSSSLKSRWLQKTNNIWWKYDVFLSFFGDTRNSFTDHLYAALQRKGILTFKDEEKLERGKPISQELLKAINESRFAIVILSRNYASSTWCLDELVEIIQCMKENEMIVIPVFYDVDPSDVRKQTGAFAKAFIDHKRSTKKLKKIERWKVALRELANIAGWHLRNRREADFIQNIVEVILRELSSKFSSITKNLVGIDSSVKELITSYLDFGGDVFMIGICGMGGLGKTTLARVIYEKYSNDFEGSTFIANVREVSEKQSLLPLQKQLLAQTLEERNIDIWDVYDGVDMIKKRLCQKRVLVVLDDVNQLDQLEKLVGEYGWFGLGSWIIITTRDEHLLLQYEVHKICKPNTLNDHDALKLFCLKAFKNEQPREGYVQLSENVISYAKGLPLALVTLGSFLFGRTINEWQSALDSLKKNPKKEIFDILKVSYDGLEKMWKDIFLDIACFLRGKTKDQVIDILENRGFDARIGISVLLDKSLLILENKTLWMHDLLQELGREIVRRESCEEPGKRSRLWLCKDLLHIMTKDSATESIQAIGLTSLDGDPEEAQSFEEYSEAFSKMFNLRLLMIDDLHIPNGLNHVSNSLRHLIWNGYSSKCLPSSFQPKELVKLELHFSNIEYLWKGVKYLDKLKSIDLSDSKFLIRTPDVSGLPRLERLYLIGCHNLVEIHPSIGQLRRLVVLDLESCRSLMNPPSMSAEMESLTILNLYDCINITNIPEFKGIMKSLSELSLNKTAVEKLPSSIEYLTALTSLNLGDCQNLECLPSNMDSLSSLEKLLLSGCLKLCALPENVWKMKCLKQLDLSGSGIRFRPDSSSFSVRRGLFSFSQNQLNFGGLFRLQRIGLNSIGFLSSLKYLTLSGNSLVTLPASISQLSKLEALDLSNCFKLQSLPELPSTVRYINAEGCYSLKLLPGLPKASPDLLKFIQSFGCMRHYYNESNGGVAFKILDHYLQGLLRSKTRYETSTEKKKEGSRTEFQIIIPAFEIPRWFTHQRVGNSIRIDLPPNWCNSRWIGFALCAKLEGYNYLFGLNSNKTFGFRARVMALGDSLHSQLNSEIVFKVSFGAGDIWILYLSRDDWLATFPNGEYNQIEVVFESCVSIEKVRNCGVSLVYEQSVEEFYQTTAQRSSSSRNSIIAYEGWDGVHHDAYEGLDSEHWSLNEAIERSYQINYFVSSFSGNDDYNDPGHCASCSLQSDQIRRL